MKERLTTYHCGKAVIKDKNKLSEAMDKLAEFEEKEKCGEWLDAIELAKIAIALQSQKWIPCSERMPEICGLKVLLTVENGYGQKSVCTAFTNYCHEGKFMFLTNEKGYCKPRGSALIESWKPVAWMPLPEPYKE